MKMRDYDRCAGILAAIVSPVQIMGSGRGSEDDNRRSNVTMAQVKITDENQVTST